MDTKFPIVRSERQKASQFISTDDLLDELLLHRPDLEQADEIEMHNEIDRHEC